jgi:hypothetical protein
MTLHRVTRFKVQTAYGLALICIGRYAAGGAIAVQLINDNDALPEPMATFSTNLVPSGAVLGLDEFNVKSWSENEDLVEPMLATGLFEDTGRRTRSGYVASPVWRLKDPSLIPPLPRKQLVTV